MTTVLHRTPVHHEALEWVYTGKIEWRPKAGPWGRFGFIGGEEIGDSTRQPALHELRHAGLIHVCDKAVSATLAGARRLAEWDGVLA